MSKPRIQLAFCDFWPGFDPRDNYFTRLLSARYEIELSDEPEFLIYSCFGKAHRRHQCLRIFFTGENVRPDWNVCDYAFTFDFTDHPDHYRLPLYALYGDLRQLVKQSFDAERILAGKTRFCNFVYSNANAKTRIRFFELLSKYKSVDSGGGVLNNLGYRVQDKRAFLANYKFTIAFENESYPGYTTEKLAEPMWANSLPIYWGNPYVQLDFNPRSFVSAHDYGSLESLVDRVIDVDQNDELYLSYLRQPWFYDNRVNQFAADDHVLLQFDRIFSTPRIPKAVQRRRRWFFGPQTTIVSNTT